MKTETFKVTSDVDGNFKEQEVKGERIEIVDYVETFVYENKFDAVFIVSEVKTGLSICRKEKKSDVIRDATILLQRLGKGWVLEQIEKRLNEIENFRKQSCSDCHGEERKRIHNQ